jgi:hypothetical protein
VVFSFKPFLLFGLAFLDEILLGFRIALFLHVLSPVVDLTDVRDFQGCRTSQTFLNALISEGVLNQLSLLFDALNIIIRFTARMGSARGSLLCSHRLFNHNILTAANVLKSFLVDFT